MTSLLVNNLVSSTRYFGQISSLRNNAFQRSKKRLYRSRQTWKVNSLLKKKEGLEVVWGQDTDEVFIGVPIEDNIHKNDIYFEIHPKRLKLHVKNEMMLEGSLEDVGLINKDGCFWVIEERDGLRMIVIYLQKHEMGYQNWQEILEGAGADTTITDKVFLNIQIGEQDFGKIIIGLYGKEVPLTVKNFKCLCTGEKGVGQSGKELHFKNSIFHRIIPQFMAQGGDFVNGDGTGGESIYGDIFDDEKLRIKHDKAGLLSMANKGPDTNSSQFFILFEAAPHLDDNHVVFGEVLSGMENVRQLEGAGAEDGTPKRECKITDCGVIQSEEQLEEFEAERRVLAVEAASTESKMKVT
eukprot:TRINITY_DN23111_c0_g1_i1.p1 TRINITY_DN23111_c0_g1~~TRINITY_DN23111_c0_g1_i1.p1  ORF type:complete len:375 (+),score=62.16 TRINITY_DN23111_c0_g1_i1:68-1126(+)